MAKTKTAKRQKDIKSKLIAAICMLLVSTIMMVSSTYAWFTLSTAPEVTGITTAVGANGNLEMALMPKDGIVGDDPKDENFGIKSEVGDSLAGPAEKNITWGNLVDLSVPEDGASIYGLEKISLYPATLNLINGKFEPDGAILQTPEYGADGRVESLAKDAVTSIYTVSEQDFIQEEGYGVRAVGTASGMTDRQLAFRNYSSLANSNMEQAKIQASQSLKANGAALANVAVEKALGSGNFTPAHVNSLKAIVTDLLGDGTKKGVLQYIDEAYRYNMIAYFASAEFQTEDTNIPDAAIKTLENAILGAESAKEALGAIQTQLAALQITVSMPAAITGPIDMLEATKANVLQAQTELNALNKDTYVWDDLKDPMTKLADMDAMQINGVPASEATERAEEIAAGVLGGNGINVTMKSGGGVYADIADHCGDYDASILIESISVGGMDVTNVKARMETASDVPLAYLAVMKRLVTDGGKPGNDAEAGGTTMPISDFYGFIIDLAFRTNATGTNLLLQTAPEDRIYSDNDNNAETMGAGSTMTFTATTNELNEESIVGLMGAIRVVFFDPMTGEIFAYAKLDMTQGKYEVVGGTTYTASLYLYEDTPGTTTYTQVESADKFTEYKGNDTVLYTKAADSDTYTEVEDKTAIPDGADYKEYYTAATTAGGESFLTDTDAVITALTQNEAKAVSVLVYLEGEHIENSDVAATAATSMTGTLNLQFASSATLVPMNYTPLQSPGGAQTPENGGENNGQTGEEAGNGG